MGKKALMLLISIIILVIAGCGDSGSSSTSGTTTSTGGSTKAFIGGKVGLEGKFLSGAPPEEVNDQDFPFDVNIIVENQGEYDVPKEKVSLEITGIHPADFGKTGDQLKVSVAPEDLFGAKKDSQGNQISGASVIFDSFSDLQFQKKISGSPKFIVRANLCYTYGTNSIAQVCVLEDLTGRTRKTGEEPLCEATNTKVDVENSGAPVHIDNFAQTVTGKDKISFSFNIKHVGDKDNRVAERGSTCAPEVAKKDRIFVSVETDLNGLKCSGLSGGTGDQNDGIEDGFVKLFGENSGSEERAVFCSQPLPADRTDFQKQVKISLEYDYKQYFDKELTVKHIE
jgi:hypothetical protein